MLNSNNILIDKRARFIVCSTVHGYSDFKADVFFFMTPTDEICEPYNAVVSKFG